MKDLVHCLKIKWIPILSNIEIFTDNVTNIKEVGEIKIFNMLYKLQYVCPWPNILFCMQIEWINDAFLRTILHFLKLSVLVYFIKVDLILNIFVELKFQITFI